MRHENGQLWLTPAEWIAWNWKHHPERFRPAQRIQPQEMDPRKEAKQWRAGRAQGVLSRASPLAAERAKVVSS